MLPRSYRGRYSIVILISLLVHVAILVFVLMELGDFFKAEKTEQTITINLKQQKEEPKKEEPKKEEPKKEEPKKEEPKKEEPKKEEPKKEEPKKEEPKKEEPKKEEPKKEEPKKEEPKKEEPKKEELKKEEPQKEKPSKGEPSKGEPSKGEPSKGEPSKGEPSKGEPSKGEPSKGEPSKGEPKKAEPKKAEPKKAEPKKAEPKKAEPKKGEPSKGDSMESKPKKGEPEKLLTPMNPYQTSMDMYGTPEDLKLEALRQGEAIPAFGSMQMLDDREMQRQIIHSRGFDNRFQKREQDGQKLSKTLSVLKRQELNQHLLTQMEYIFSFFVPPKKDGRQYYGEISLLLDDDGKIEEITLKRPSGHTQLDLAALKSAEMSKRLALPKDALLRRIMTTKPLTLTFDQDDMAD